MARRNKRKIDWSHLRYLIESNLNACSISQVPVKIDGKIDRIDDGLSHNNYKFQLAGEEWKERPMLLRLIKYKDTSRTKKEINDITSDEAKTLKALEKIEFKYETPRFICMIEGESGQPEGFIETFVQGASLPFLKNTIHQDKILPIIAEVTVAVHQLPTSPFQHLTSYGNNKEHVIKLLNGLPQELYNEYPSTQKVKEWILANLKDKNEAVVLHGDLLPQNVLFSPNNDKVFIVDWEYARLGDPAYDFAIVSRGNQKILGQKNGLKRLLKFYKDAGGLEITMQDVNIHELILVFNWIWESYTERKKGKHDGHGPDYFEQQMLSILRRAEKMS